MLIGAHVSTAGGLRNAVERGVETGSNAIQIFHQSPRMWRPTAYSEDDFAEFREAFDASRMKSVTIHAIYLINCASKERDVRRKSVTSLKHALRVGDGIGADGVVLHAGARKGEPHAASVKRAGKAIAAALADTESCPLLLENTAGTQGPLGRSFEELADLVEAAGASKRLGTCLDSCHLLAAGYEIRSPDALGEVIEEFDARVGLNLLRCTHVNDSKVGLGANRDLHATLGKGELGERGLSVFLSEPAFDELPMLLETGREGHAPAAEDVDLAKRLRKRGLAARRRRRSRAQRKKRSS
jgi:deoxyribonuclease-4